MRPLTLIGLLRGLFSVLLFSFMLSVQAAESGLLWQFSTPGGKTSYLFGTIHTDDPRVNDLSPTLVQALTASEAFAMEILPADDPALYYMRHTTLQNHLNESELEQVKKLADFHSMQESTAMRMKPWLLAMVFDLSKPQSPYTQDAQLLGLAQSHGKQVMGLEEAKTHFSVLDNFPLEDHLTMLRAVLKRSQADRERDFEALIKAYVAGDASRIAALNDSITGRMLPGNLWAKMRLRLVDERNVLMAQRIIAEAETKTLFVAVGASHLPGENGLLDLLHKAGYTVKAVKQAK